MSSSSRVAAPSAPPAGWAELVRDDPNATPAHRSELWDAWCAADPTLVPTLLTVERDGELIGGTPVVCERRGGLTWLHALPWVLSGAPLAQPGRHAEVDEEIARQLASLQRERHVVGGAWALYRPDGPPPDPGVIERLSGHTRTVETALVDLNGGLDGARRRIDRKTRQNLAQAQRTLAIAEEPEALAAAYALHVRQAQAWRARRPLPLEVSRRLLAAGGRPPCARLFTARDRHGLLAAVLVLDHPREAMLWWSGTHVDGRARSAFTALAWGIVEWAAAAGRARVNLGASPMLGGVAAFKESLGARIVSYPVRWLDARHAPLAGRVAGWLQEQVRRGRPRGEPA